ncbi:unnamed protein product, partial [Cladocopium goreaui]
APPMDVWDLDNSQPVPDKWALTNFLSPLVLPADIFDLRHFQCAGLADFFLHRDANDAVPEVPDVEPAHPAMQPAPILYSLKVLLMSLKRVPNEFEDESIRRHLLGRFGLALPVHRIAAFVALAQTLLAVDVGTPGIDRDGSGGLQSAQWREQVEIVIPKKYLAYHTAFCPSISPSLTMRCPKWPLAVFRYAAAVVGGYLTLEAALQIVAARAKSTEDLAEEGAMLSVADWTAEELEAVATGQRKGLWLAAAARRSFKQHMGDDLGIMKLGYTGLTT